MPQHNEKITFKNIYVNNAVDTDLKNMLAHFYDIFWFLILHKFNSVCLVSQNI